MQEVQYCSVKRKLAKGLWYALGTVRSLRIVHLLFIAGYILHLAVLRKCSSDGPAGVGYIIIYSMHACDL